MPLLIVVSFLESVVRDHSADRAVAVVDFDDTFTAEPYTTLLDFLDCRHVNPDCRGRESRRVM